MADRDADGEHGTAEAAKSPILRIEGRAARQPASDNLINSCLISRPKEISRSRQSWIGVFVDRDKEAWHRQLTWIALKGVFTPM
jgi:hypothetical protein